MDNEIPVGDEQLAQSAPTSPAPARTRAPRRNANLCPACNSPMRAVHITKNVGGFELVPHHFSCPNCLAQGNARVFKVMYTQV